jgi:hypothetical protein
MISDTPQQNNRGLITAMCSGSVECGYIDMGTNHFVRRDLQNVSSLLPHPNNDPLKLE